MNEFFNTDDMEKCLVCESLIIDANSLYTSNNEPVCKICQEDLIRQQEEIHEN